MSKTRTEQFQRVLTRLLRPIARAMIANGVTLNTAVEALKKALVDAAQETQEDVLSDSKISLLTGLHRKDTRRLRNETVPSDRRPALNACALAIATWTNSDAFLDSDGTPAILNKQGRPGQPGFGDLVRRARIDLPPATVLDALQAQGAVSIDPEDKTVTLLKDVFVGDPGSEAMLSAFEKNVVAHLSAATDNLLASDTPAPHFERGAHFNQLCETSVESLIAEGRNSAMELLQAINGKALALQDKDEDSGDPKARFSMGVYIFSQAEDDRQNQDGDT